MRWFFYVVACYLFLISCSNKNIWYSIGDSITYQNNKLFDLKGFGLIKVVGYQSVFNLNLHSQERFKIENLGYSGFITPSKKGIWGKIINRKFCNAKLITIFIGTNDFRQNVPIYTDEGNGFYNAYVEMINYIKKESNCKIILITPMRRDYNGKSFDSINSIGLKLDDYVDAVKKLGLMNNVQVVDLYNHTKLSEPYLNEVTFDGLHPNNKGHNIIGELLFEEWSKNRT